MRNVLILGLLVSLLSSLGACTRYQEKIVREAPSSYLLEHFTEAAEPLTYEEYMSLYWKDYKGLIRMCNGRLDSIKAEYPENGSPK